MSFLFKDSVLYGGAGAISKSLSLITFPLLARHFSVEDYGILDFFFVLANFLTIVFIFGQDSAVARFFYEYEGGYERRQMISQSLAFQFLCLVLLLPPLWWGSGWVMTLFVSSLDYSIYFKIVMLQLPFLLLINFSQNLLKWTFNRARFLLVSLGYAVAQTSLLLIVILVLDAEIEGVLLVSLGVSFVFGLLGLFLVRDWLTPPKDMSRLIELLPFAAPVGVVCTLGALSPALERALTVQLLGSTDLGLYAAGTKVAMLIALVITAFQTAWGPFSISIHKQNDASHTYSWVLRLFVMGMCALVFVLSLAAKPLINLLASSRYDGAAVVVFPLLLGLAIQATGWISEIGISISKRSHLNLYGYLVGVAVTLLTLLLLSPVLGLIGVGISVMLGHIVKAITTSWLAQRAYYLPWNYSPVVRIYTLTLLSGILAIWSDHVWGGAAYSVALVLAGGLVVGIGWLTLFSRIERAKIVSVFWNVFKMREA